MGIFPSCLHSHHSFLVDCVCDRLTFLFSPRLNVVKQALRASLQVFFYLLSCLIWNLRRALKASRMCAAWPFSVTCIDVPQLLPNKQLKSRLGLYWSLYLSIKFTVGSAGCRKGLIVSARVARDSLFLIFCSAPISNPALLSDAASVRCRSALILTPHPLIQPLTHCARCAMFVQFLQNLCPCLILEL